MRPAGKLGVSPLQFWLICLLVSAIFWVAVIKAIISLFR